MSRATVTPAKAAAGAGIVYAPPTDIADFEAWRLVSFRFRAHSDLTRGVLGVLPNRGASWILMFPFVDIGWTHAGMPRPLVDLGWRCYGAATATTLPKQLASIASWGISDFSVGTDSYGEPLFLETST